MPRRTKPSAEVMIDMQIPPFPDSAMIVIASAGGSGKPKRE